MSSKIKLKVGDQVKIVCPNYPNKIKGLNINRIFIIREIIEDYFGVGETVYILKDEPIYVWYMKELNLVSGGYKFKNKRVINNT